MTQSDLQPPALVVVHPIALLATPSLGGEVRALLDNGETLIAGQAQDGFIEVQTLGASAVLCLPQRVRRLRSAPPKACRRPMLGSQSPCIVILCLAQDARAWMVLPEDPLVLLGRDQAFALVQCFDGRVGYIPAGLCGLSKDPEAFIPFGPIDIGWLVVGGAWFFPNGLVVKNVFLIEVPFFAPALIYLESLLVLGMAAILWWLASPRVAARSFTLGIAIAYARLLMLW